MRKNILIFIAGGLFLLSSPVWALYFRLDGDRLWLQVQDTPLAEVLNQFASAGVDVRLDPSLQIKITGAIRGQDLDHALESILNDCDYLLTWKVLRGPLGPVPKLKEIQVFSPGKESAAQPVPRRSTRFETSRGVSGTTPEYIKDELLVGAKPGTTYAQFQDLLDQIGGMLVDGDASTGVYLIRFPPGTNVEALLAQLSGNPLLAHAELNYVTRLPGDLARAAVESDTLPAVTPPANGAIPVAVLDSGLDPHAGLGAVLAAGWDAVDPERALADPAGHGTQMAYLASGVLAADGLSSASTLPLVSVRAFDENGITSNFALMQALAYAAKAGAKVVNLSWGSATDSDFMRTAIQTAADQGLILVAAAGNEPTGAPVYPAAYDNVLAVGGVTADGQVWANSNHGDFVDLSASATATLPVGYHGPAGTYAGTSISSAAVANALAQYLNRHPTASTTAALAALAKALSPAPAGGYGTGLLDAAALQRFLNP